MRSRFFTSFALLGILVLTQGCGNNSAPLAPAASSPDAVNRFSSGAFASQQKTFGTETQNGGYGVVIDGKAYSLDLTLRSSNLNPYLSENVPISLSADQIAELQSVLTFASPRVFSIVTHKLTELRKLAEAHNKPVDVDAVIEAAYQYTWVPTNAKCTDVGDDHSPLESKLQLAYRQGAYIRICSDFDRLDDANKAALIVHEIIYASANSQVAVQELVGLLFNASVAHPLAKTESEITSIFNDLAGPVVSTFPVPVNPQDGLVCLTQPVQDSAVAVSSVDPESELPSRELAWVTHATVSRQECASDSFENIDFLGADGRVVLTLQKASAAAEFISITPYFIGEANVERDDQSRITQVAARIQGVRLIFSLRSVTGDDLPRQETPYEEWNRIANGVAPQTRQTEPTKQQPKQVEHNPNWENSEKPKQDPPKQDQPKQDQPKRDRP